MMNKKIIESQHGVGLITIMLITTFALLITGISISTYNSKNRVLTQAQEIQAQVKAAEEQNNFDLAILEAEVEANSKGNNSVLDADDFQEIVDRIFGEGKAIVGVYGTTYKVKVLDTGNEYEKDILD